MAPESDAGPIQLRGRRHVPGGEVQTARVGYFRFWYDEKKFKGTGEDSLVQKALIAAGGIRMGGNAKKAPALGPMGWQRPRDWDLYFSPSGTALKAAEYMRSDQFICAMPGLTSITRKRQLPVTLRSVYGQVFAESLTPTTFSLPTEVKSFRDHLQTCDDSGELWILKTAQHLGKGLKIVPASRAIKEVMTRARSTGPSLKPYVVAQKYIPNPMLINGHKFGLRIWALITNYAPLTVYIHQNGLVLFSNNEYQSSEYLDSSGHVASGHVTNYAQNVDGQVWSLAQLREHLSPDVYNPLYGTICKSVAQVFSASLSNIRSENRRLACHPGSGFELLGLDYLIDDSMQPWLLEVNSTPSLAVSHSDPDVERMIREQKGGMVADMVRMLRLQDRFGNRSPVVLPRPVRRPPDEAGEGAAAGLTAPAAAQAETLDMPRYSRNELARGIRRVRGASCPDPAAEQHLATVEMEMGLRGGFLPLMPLFPHDARERGWDIPWGRKDKELMEWWAVRQQLQEQLEVRL